MQPDQQQRIMGYFIEEAQEHLNTIEQGLLNLQRTIDDPEAANEMFRAAHSVKGGAAMLGLTSIQQAAHRLEDYFKILKENPVQADQKLETYFLRGYDALAALVQQLQTSGGLVDSETQPITNAAEENFAQLQQHLSILTQQTPVSSPEKTPSIVPSAFAVASAQEESALLLTFRSDVPDCLRQMLQLFRQKDTPETRNQLQRLCSDLQRMGDQFELPAWSALLKASQQAVGNPENTYRQLAPVLIKEIKQAQNLVVAGQENNITLSQALQDLLPADAITDASAPDLDFADLLDDSDDQISTTSLDLPSFESVLSDTDDVDLPMGLNNSSDQEPSLPSLSSPQFNASDDLPGPAVGIAELNSLADLFEGENLDLGSTWQTEDLIGDGNLFDDTSGSEGGSDFDDLLFDEGSQAETNSLSDDDLGLGDDDFLGIPDEQPESFAAPLDEIPEPSPVIPQSLPGGISPEQSEAVDMALDNLGELFSGLDEAELAADGLISIGLPPQDQAPDLSDVLLEADLLDQPLEQQSTSLEFDDSDAIDNDFLNADFDQPSDSNLAEDDDSDLDLDGFLDEPTSDPLATADDTGLDLLDEIDLSEPSIPEAPELNLSSDLDALENEAALQSRSSPIDLSGDLDQDAEFIDFSEGDSDGTDLSLETDLAPILEDEPSVQLSDITADADDDVNDLLDLAVESDLAGTIAHPPDESQHDLGLDLILTEEAEDALSELDSTYEPGKPQADQLSDLPNSEALDFSEMSEFDLPDNRLSELFDDSNAFEESEALLDHDSTDADAVVLEGSGVDPDQFSLGDLGDLGFDEGSNLASETPDNLNFDELGEPAVDGPQSDSSDLLGFEAMTGLAPSASEPDAHSGFSLEQVSDANDELDDALAIDLFGQDLDSDPADGSSDFEGFDEIPDLQIDEADPALEFRDLANLTEATLETDEELGLGDADLENFGEAPQITFDPIDDDQFFDKSPTETNFELSLDQDNAWDSLEELEGEDTAISSIPDETLIELSQGSEPGDADALDALDIEGMLAENDNLNISESSDLDVDFDLSSELLDFDSASTESSSLEAFDNLLTDQDTVDATGTPLAPDLDLDSDLDLDQVLADDADLGDSANFGPGLAEEASDLDSLDNLLSTDLDNGSAISPVGLTDDSADAFSDLDALLDTPAPTSSAAATSKDFDSSDSFDDLDKLLEDANSKLGGPPAIAPRGAASRPPRRSVIEQTMRVPVKQLDNLSNLVGEMVVNRNSLEQDQERLRQFLDNLLYQVQQLSDVGQRMRDLYERSLLESSLLASRQSYQMSDSSDLARAANHATGADFDALEMDRFTAFHSLSQEMIELIVRVRESASDIEFIINEPLDQVTRNFRQVTTQLQEGLTRARMVPFSLTADRLPRGVRDNAIKEGKQAELVVEGRDTLIDKMILEQLTDPLNHLVNNAVAHGIEQPDVRQAAGKNPVGRITVRAFHQGNQTVISVSDDGAGIDPERIKAKAIEKGLITPAEASAMSRLDVYDLLFRPGFSGAEKVTDLAGRGVGMDVVRTSLNEIRGTISIDSSIGRGTSFTIRLPLTLSISKALCCISNRARIAFPMDGVEDMLDVPRERIQSNAEGQECISWRDMQLPFKPLADVLKYNRSLGRGSVYGGSQEDDIISIVVLRSAGNYTALQVDQVMGEYEIVIKQLEGPVPKPIGIAGATVLGDGRIMPIADVLELIDLCMGRIQDDKTWESTGAAPNITVTIEEQDKREPTVLIVDDSITVRELLSMTFSKVGYRVEQARDGQDAWEKLRSGLPCDIVFCDIEMPRMDGLELLSRIQKEPSLGQLPIAMLTSRGADRHRQMAIQMGARGYFTKPYLEEVLLDAAQRMLKGEVLVTVNS